MCRNENLYRNEGFVDKFVAQYNRGILLWRARSAEGAEGGQRAVGVLINDGCQKSHE